MSEVMAYQNLFIPKANPIPNIVSVVAIMEATLDGKRAMSKDTTEIQAKLSDIPITILKM